MVDFQSRDRRRDRDDSDATTDDSDDGPDATADESGGSENPADETATEPPAGVDGDGVGIAVATVDVDATTATGDAVVEVLEDTAHEVVTREHLAGDHDGVQQIVDRFVGREDVDAVLTCGGVGVHPDARTVEAVHPLFEKALPGFGELFRLLYHDSAGTDVVGTRATAGIADRTPVFCLPGEADAARLGTAEIVAEQATALVADADPTR